jgi:formylglycine-generating enzyme required for sulfatase activity
MIGVTWRGAEMFCQWLTEREQKAKRLPKDYEYRLPTEAEWEYCCRAGSEGKYCSGDSKDDLHEYGWYRENSKDKTHPAGEKKPNKWKICDMHGNVWEWCYDWYDGPYLVSEEMTDPTGSDASEDNLKILRGGSFSSSVSDLKSSVRYSFDYRSSKKNAGFRVVCGPRL